MNAGEAKERRTAWTMLIVCPLSMMLIFVYVTLGYANGLAAGHPMEYLQMTCILWAIITTVPPILRLVRAVSLPLWFLIMVYAVMYLYVLSLCHGMYFDMDWWANFTHVISSMVIAAIVFVALCLMQAKAPAHVTFGSRGGMVSLVIMVALSFGAIWEVMEGYTDIITSMDYMSYGALHTMGNLAADMIGVLIMALIAWLMLGRHDVKTIASEVRLGPKNIDTAR
jgi:hypothetical protein